MTSARAAMMLGHLRAALPEIERADALCREPETWTARRDAAEGLGRIDALRALYADMHGEPTIQQAIDRVSATPHGIEATDALVARASTEADPSRQRALYDHALDELERVTHDRGVSFTIADNPTALTPLAGDRWLSLNVGGGIVLREGSWRMLALDVEWVDETGVMAWVSSPSGSSELWNLDDVSRVLDGRTITQQTSLADGTLVWVEQHDTLHLFKDRTERTHPLGGTLDGEIRTTKSNILRWSTGDSVHTFDPKTDTDSVVTEGGKHLVTFVAEGDWAVFAWERGPVVVRHRDVEEARAVSSAASVALDVPSRVAWFDDVSRTFVVLDLKTKKKRTVSAEVTGKAKMGCAGGGVTQIDAISGTSISARCESGDVGSEVAFDVRTGVATAESSWSPADDFDATNAQEALCKLAHVDCGPCDGRCVAYHETSAGPVLSVPGAAFRVDAGRQVSAQRSCRSRAQRVRTRR